MTFSISNLTKISFFDSSLNGKNIRSTNWYASVYIYLATKSHNWLRWAIENIMQRSSHSSGITNNILCFKFFSFSSYFSFFSERHFVWWCIYVSFWHWFFNEMKSTNLFIHMLRYFFFSHVVRFSLLFSVWNADVCFEYEVWNVKWLVIFPCLLDCLMDTLACSVIFRKRDRSTQCKHVQMKWIYVKWDDFFLLLLL